MTYDPLAPWNAHDHDIIKRDVTTANLQLCAYILALRLWQNVRFCLACGQAIAANDHPQWSVLALYARKLISERVLHARTIKQLICVIDGHVTTYCHFIGSSYSRPGDRWMVLQIPYSRKIWWGIKFGGWVVYITTAKLRSTKISYSHTIIRMAIPYRTAKFKSANIFLIVIWGSTAKFNARQYFRLYGSACLNTTWQRTHFTSTNS